MTVKVCLPPWLGSKRTLIPASVLAPNWNKVSGYFASHVLTAHHKFSWQVFNFCNKTGMWLSPEKTWKDKGSFTSQGRSVPSGPLQDTESPLWSFCGMGRVMVAFCWTWVSVPVPLEVVSLQLISSSEIPPSSPWGWYWFRWWDKVGCRL